jgi:hypothetical protein
MVEDRLVKFPREQLDELLTAQELNDRFNLNWPAHTSRECAEIYAAMPAPVKVGRKKCWRASDMVRVLADLKSKQRGYTYHDLGQELGRAEKMRQLGHPEFAEFGERKVDDWIASGAALTSEQLAFYLNARCDPMKRRALAVQLRKIKDAVDRAVASVEDE